MQRQPVPHPGPAGTFKMSTAASSGAPRSDSSRPRHTPGKRKSRKWGSEAAARGPLPGPDPREGGCGPRQGLPCLRGPRRRRAGLRLKGRRLLGLDGAADSGKRPGDPRCPRHFCLRDGPTPHPCTPPAATARPSLIPPSQQPSAPEVASTRRSLSPRPAAALEPDQSGIK